MTRALEGIRVVELGRYVTGPEAGVLLADLGADVIKIESPRRGDPFRQWSAGGYSSFFCSLNRNKRSVALDVASSSGVDVLLKLLEGADVLIENFRPGQSDEWGWGHEQVSSRNPGIIYCSITGFGPIGPYRDRPGYDTVGQAMSGLLGLLTDPQAPQPMGISLSDHLTGIYACYGILGALFARAHTGRGQKVETSLLQASVAFMAENIARYFETGVVPSQRSRARTANGFAFVAKDGKPLIVHLSSPPKFWEGLAKTVGHPEWITDPRFVDAPARRKNFDELHTELSKIFATKTRAEWLDALVAADVPSAPLNTLEEVFEDPQVQMLDMKRTITHPVKGEVTLAAPGVQLSDTPLEWDLAPPLLGEHTREVLAELGYEGDEIDALLTEGIAADVSS